MKKILALLMTVAMIGSLTACGGNADTQNSAENTESIRKLQTILLPKPLTQKMKLPVNLMKPML